MVFGKKDSLVGLDIGSRSIKAAEIAETKRGTTLKRFGIVDIAQGAIEEGTIKDPESVAEQIQQLFKSYNIKENNVAVSEFNFDYCIKRYEEGTNLRITKFYLVFARLSGLHKKPVGHLWKSGKVLKLQKNAFTPTRDILP